MAGERVSMMTMVRLIINQCVVVLINPLVFVIKKSNKASLIIISLLIARRAKFVTLMSELYYYLYLNN